MTEIDDSCGAEWRREMPNETRLWYYFMRMRISEWGSEERAVLPWRLKTTAMGGDYY